MLSFPRKRFSKIVSNGPGIQDTTTEFIGNILDPRFRGDDAKKTWQIQKNIHVIEQIQRLER
jgi:hypothetical protein